MTKKTATATRRKISRIGGIKSAEPSRESAEQSPKRLEVAYTTSLGKMYIGRIEQVLGGAVGKALKGKVNLIFTSPPFPLVRKKRYGNETGERYLSWLTELAKPPRVPGRIGARGGAKGMG